MKLAVAIDLNDQDPSSIVERAGNWVARMGGTLDLLSVEGPRYALDWVGDPAVRRLMQAEAEQLRSKDAARLTELLERVGESHRGVARLLQGQPVHALIEAAVGYDALMVATHGRKGLSHFWLGSVAEQVVRQAPCAVVVLRLNPQP